MRRRDFLSVIAGATAWPLAARAQQSAMPVVGVLSVTTAESISDLLIAFRQAVAEAGYLDGKNLAIEYRFANFRPELLPELAGDLVRLNARVIVAIGPPPLAAAVRATASVPIVALDLESDPVALGYVKSLAHPEGNITGAFLDFPELSGKQLQLFKEVLPRLSRIAIFGDPGINAPQLAATETAARAVAVQAESIELRAPDEIERALAAAGVRHAEAGILLSSPLVYVYMKQISELAIPKRLPLISVFAEFPRAGGFMAYGPNMREFYRRCGDYVGKILHGAKPKDLPIQRPEKFDLVINLKTAAALGVIVPPVLLATADEVIE
jgi:putative tryptophan/tyrosine transport system substrate-binding protein